MYELIKTKSATLRKAPRKGAYIVANGRKYLTSTDDYSDLNTGITNYFSNDKTKVKRIQNYI